MISNVKQLIANRVSDLREDELSVIFMRTAQPKTLVFRKGFSSPLYVVQFGPREALVHTHKCLVDLTQHLSSQVPESLLCESYSGELWVQVQTGLHGTPWFTVSRKIKTNDQWAELRDRALATLTSFHGAVRKNVSWTAPLNVADELKLVFIEAREKGYIASENVEQHVSQSVNKLKSIGIINCHFQHGDFCLNNLMVGSENISIIDFEHFGHTLMPFHDDFLLAESLADFHPVESVRLMPEVYQKCLSRVDLYNHIDATQLEGFYLHHLLWWIAETESIELRAVQNERYKKRLSFFSAASPEERRALLGVN